MILVKKINELEKYRNFCLVDCKSLIDGGLIVQQSQLSRIKTKADFLPAKTTYKGKEYATERMPGDKEYEDMIFGWSVEMGITSNSVIYVKNGETVGIGTGEQDRVGVAEIAVFKAYTKYADALCFKNYGVSYKTLEMEVARGERDAGLLQEIDEETRKNKGGLIGAVMVSDAFFPFRDGIEVGINQGVTAVVQPGGSERDFEVIEACNEANPKVAMVFTGQRVFKH